LILKKIAEIFTTKYLLLLLIALGLYAFIEPYWLEDKTYTIVSHDIPEKFQKRIGSISCLPVMNSPKPPPHKLPIRTGYVNFGHPSLPIYRICAILRWI
jgi:hypothetical protein